MLIILVLKSEKLLILVSLAAGRAEQGRQQAMSFEQLLVVKGEIQFGAGKDHQPAATPEILFEGIDRVVREIGHIGQDNRIKIVEARLRQLRDRDRRRLDKKLGCGVRCNGHQSMTRKIGFALARFVARLAIDQQHPRFFNRPRRHAPGIVRSKSIGRNARGNGMKTFGAQFRKKRDAFAGAGSDGIKGKFITRRIGVHVEAHADRACLLFAVIGHLDFEAQRLINR